MRTLTKTFFTLFASLSLLFACAGCGNDAPGTSRSMGPVPFDKVFEAAKTVVPMYYTIESADPQSGLILCRQEYGTGTSDRLLGNTPSRELARVQVRQAGPNVIVYVQITLQRQMLTSERQISRGMNYSGVPNQTPSETTAATTPEQNISWNTVKHDYERENAMLNDIAAALAGRPVTQPATRPTTTPATRPTTKPIARTTQRATS